MKVKSLEDLECIATRALAPSDDLPFDLYLYLETNQRIVHLVRKGDTLTPEMLEQYISKGIQELRISKEDRALYDEFALNAKRSGTKGLNRRASPANSGENVEDDGSQVEPETAPLDELAIANETPNSGQLAGSGAARQHNAKRQEKPLNKTPGGPSSSASSAHAGLSHPAPASHEPAPLLPEKFDDATEDAFQDSAGTAMGGSPSEEARRILKEALNSETQTLKPEDTDSTRELIEEAVKVALPHLHELVENAFGIHSHFIQSAHGVRVSLYATLLGLAFDRSDLKSVSTLAVAGLFHDIGFAYDSGQGHVKAGVRCLTETVRHIPRGIVDIIKAHHELYDGSGYPDRLTAFEIHPMSQILLMADTLDEFVTGKRDGNSMTFTQAFDAFAKLETTPSRPKLFHPEFYRRVVKYVRETDLTEALYEATAIVGEATESLVHGSSDAAEPPKDPNKS